MRKPWTFFTFILFLFAVLPLAVRAQASLYISPSSGTYKIGELFSVLVNVNTGGESINAASGQINFDNSRLEVTSAGYSRSIFTIWTEEPVYSNAGGTLRFSGGLPNPGFTGASGAILRITFKPKSIGQAPVVFVSGSVLANDGNGTNILDNLNGALFSIVSPAAEKPAPKPVAPSQPSPEVRPSSFQEAEKPFAPPIITDWPKELEEGSTLTIRGLGFPNSKILVFLQKGSGDPFIEERFAGPDGRFAFTFDKTVTSGLYRVWAKDISQEGVAGASSEVVVVEVVKPLFFRIGTIALNYASIIVTLLALLIFAFLLFGWFWFRVRKLRARRGTEISEAEQVLHTGFDTLKEGLAAYIRYLAGAKTEKGIKRREEKTREGLKEELGKIEKEIEKEIEDIKK